MDYLAVFRHMESGQPARRAGWPKHRIIFLRPPFECDAPTFEKIQSVPDPVKKWISDVILSDDFEGQHIYRFTRYISCFDGECIKNTWRPDPNDLTAKDWVVADE